MGIFGRHRIKRPVEGHAEIVEAWERNKEGQSGNCRMKLLLDDVPGIEPRVVDNHEAFMVDQRWPEVGMRVAVTVDAKHPDRVKVHWESVFGRVRGGIAGVGLEMFAREVGVEVDLSTGPDREADRPVAADYQQQIAELNARFAAGEITYEEMAAGVQRVLGG